MARQSVKRHRYTANDSDELLAKLMAIAKSAVTHKDSFRDLTEAEELHITRLAQSDDEETAPEHETEARDPRDVQESLEDASDEAIQKLYKGTVRELADAYRRGR